MSRTKRFDGGHIHYASLTVGDGLGELRNGGIEREKEAVPGVSRVIVCKRLSL